MWCIFCDIEHPEDGLACARCDEHICDYCAEGGLCPECVEEVMGC